MRMHVCNILYIYIYIYRDKNLEVWRDCGWGTETSEAYNTLPAVTAFRAPRHVNVYDPHIAGETEMKKVLFLIHVTRVHCFPYPYTLHLTCYLVRSPNNPNFSDAIYYTTQASVIVGNPVGNTARGVRLTAQARPDASPSTRELQLFVVGLRATYVLQIPSPDTAVTFVRHQISALTGLPVNLSFFLTLRGKILHEVSEVKEVMTLADYGVCPDDTVRVSFRLLGGANSRSAPGNRFLPSGDEHVSSSDHLRDPSPHSRRLSSCASFRFDARDFGDEINDLDSSFASSSSSSSSQIDYFTPSPRTWPPSTSSFASSSSSSSQIDYFTPSPRAGPPSSIVDVDEIMQVSASPVDVVQPWASDITQFSPCGDINNIDFDASQDTVSPKFGSRVANGGRMGFEGDQFLSKSAGRTATLVASPSVTALAPVRYVAAVQPRPVKESSVACDGDGYRSVVKPYPQAGCNLLEWSFPPLGGCKSDDITILLEVVTLAERNRDRVRPIAYARYFCFTCMKPFATVHSLLRGADHLCLKGHRLAHLRRLVPATYHAYPTFPRPTYPLYVHPAYVPVNKPRGTGGSRVICLGCGRVLCRMQIGRKHLDIKRANAGDGRVFNGDWTVNGDLVGHSGDSDEALWGLHGSRSGVCQYHDLLAPIARDVTVVDGVMVGTRRPPLLCERALHDLQEKALVTSSLQDGILSNPRFVGYDRRPFVASDNPNNLIAGDGVASVPVGAVLLSTAPPQPVFATPSRVQSPQPLGSSDGNAVVSTGAVMKAGTGIVAGGLSFVSPDVSSGERHVFRPELYSLPENLDPQLFSDFLGDLFGRGAFAGNPDQVVERLHSVCPGPQIAPGDSLFYLPWMRGDFDSVFLGIVQAVYDDPPTPSIRTQLHNVLLSDAETDAAAAIILTVNSKIRSATSASDHGGWGERLDQFKLRGSAVDDARQVILSLITLHRYTHNIPKYTRNYTRNNP